MALVVSKLLGRPLIQYKAPPFDYHRIAVTGGAGSIGRRLVGGGLPPQGGIWTSIDLPGAYDAIGTDILDYDRLVSTLDGHKADMVVHAAASKHAPYGEDYPSEVADLNVRGTENVVRACIELGIERLVFTSTCKAAEPETVYGASKLVGERIVLNAGFTVARFYNVIETTGNVFEIWRACIEKGNQCPVMDARRRFIHLGEATSFVLSCFMRPPGRYVPYAESINMRDLYHSWLREHAERNTGMYLAPLRRGDRYDEPAWGGHEAGISLPDGSFRVVSPHD